MKYPHFLGRHAFVFRSVTTFASDAEYQAYYREVFAGMPRMKGHNVVTHADGRCFAVPRKRHPGEVPSCS